MLEERPHARTLLIALEEHRLCEDVHRSRRGPLDAGEDQLRELECAQRLGRHRPRQSDGAPHRIVVDDVDKAPLVGLGRLDTNARQEHPARATEPDEIDQTSVRARTGDNTESNLGLTKPASRGSDAKVTGHRQLQAAADRRAVDGGDRGPTPPGDPIEQIDVDGPKGILLAASEEFCDVGPRHEPTGHGARHHEQVRGITQIIERTMDLVDQLEREGVRRLWSIDRQRGHETVDRDVQVRVVPYHSKNPRPLLRPSSPRATLSMRICGGSKREPRWTAR